MDSNGLFLISEQLSRDNYEIIESKDSNKDIYIQGIFAEAELVTRNKTYYPFSVMESSVKSFKNRINETGPILGEFEHPKSLKINSKNACIEIQDLYMEGKKVLGKARVLQGLVWGDHLAGLIRNGHNRPVSTRSVGQLQEGCNYKTITGMKLITVDVVDNNSCPTATPDAIYESVNWLYDLGSIDGHEAQLLEDFKKNHTSYEYKNVSKMVNNFILRGFDKCVNRAILESKLSGLN